VSSRARNGLAAAPEISGQAPGWDGASRFPPALEAEFRSVSLAQNVPRARYSTAIYLLFVLAVTAMNMLGGLAPFPDTDLTTIFLLRLGVACPALVLILCAVDVEALQSHYQKIVSCAVVALGTSVMAISATAAAAGLPQFQMGDVLVIVYACLFVGLAYRNVIVVASLLVCAFLILGVSMGVAPGDLTFAGLVIVVTALMAVLSAGRVERLQRIRFIEARKLNELAERDGLTGLFNRRKFDSLVDQLWQQARRDQRLLQIVLVDIDCFKIYNDLCGHQAGDECIRRIARVMHRAARRPLDFCARYGGEEFVLVLYGPSERTRTVLEQIRKEVMEEQIPHQGSTAASVVTVSVGSAIGDPESGRSLAGVIQQADEALYTAKKLGRNRVVDSGLVDAGAVTGTFELRSVS
jgi:diguanylate cyclase (GGDEF)-like protein